MTDTLTSDDIMKIVEGQTVPSLFLRTLAEHGDRVALRWRNDDESWSEMTFAEYGDKVARIAGGLAERGVNPGDRVVMMMRNIPEFHLVDLAATFLGATPVSIYNSSSSEQIEYLVNHCDATLGIVEDVGFLARFRSVQAQLPTLKGLGIIKDPAGTAGDDVFTLDDLLASEPIDLEAAAAAVDPDSMATMIYTSGTTGPPKGVMLTHRNIAWTCEALRLALPFEDAVGKRVVSYLPMAHIAERTTSHYSNVAFAYEVTTCPEPGQIGTYLKETRPEFFFGVPRVFEKIYAGLNAALGADPEKKAKFDEAIEAALPIVEAMDWGTATPEQLETWDFLDGFVFAPIRAMLGIENFICAVTGAAPIPPDMLRWFRAIGMPLSEIYGMSENTGPMTWTPVRVKPGTVGPAIPGCEIALADDGEVICRGGHVFSGYLHDPEKTAEALDEDGWLHTGDIGVIDEDGYLRIVDRKKELIITAGGKNISPANLEAALKMIPLVGQAMAIGDQRPFVSALVVLDPEVAPIWAKHQGIEFDTLTELAEHPVVVAEIEKDLAEVMSEFNNAERVKKVKVLGEEWLPDSDLLTPTSKLKRRGVTARYGDDIEALYER